MDAAGLRFLHLLWCNFAGLRCTRCVVLQPVDAADGRPVEAAAASLSRACITLPVHADAPPPDSGNDGMGNVRLSPDRSTIRAVPWAFGGRADLALVTMRDDLAGGQPWVLCPRGLLQRVLARAEEEHGLSFRAGFEIEFVLADCEGKPTCTQTYCSTSAFDATAPLLEEMVVAIHSLGLRVEQVHKESAPGQFELVLQHLPALQAADGLLLAKQAIVVVAHRHKLRASFLPKVSPGEAGSGCHVHLSVWKQGQGNLSTCALGAGALEGLDLEGLVQQHGNGLLSGAFQHFLAGVHAHLPSIMCFTTPTPNSFRRLQPSTWSGCFAIWGFGNKEAPLCIPVGASTNSESLFTNFELKLCDGTANPHIALAALIAAGLVGIDHALALPPPTQVDPGAPSAETAPPRLPRDFAGAKAHLMAADRAPLRAVLGEGFVQCYLAVREAEWKALGSLRIEDEIRLLFDRY